MREVWKTNLLDHHEQHVFSGSPFVFLKAASMDRILYSVDYLFAANERGDDFVEEIRKTGLMTEEQLQMFAYKNAEALLRVTARNH